MFIEKKPTTKQLGKVIVCRNKIILKQYSKKLYYPYFMVYSVLLLFHPTQGTETEFFCGVGQVMIAPGHHKPHFVFMSSFGKMPLMLRSGRLGQYGSLPNYVETFSNYNITVKKLLKQLTIPPRINGKDKPISLNVYDINVFKIANYLLPWNENVKQYTQYHFIIHILTAGISA